MSESNWSLFGIVIAIIEFDLNYYIYSKTGSALNVVIVILTSLIIALAFIIFSIFSNLDNIQERQEELERRFIREKELEDIRLDLREIKRNVFRK